MEFKIDWKEIQWVLEGPISSGESPRINIMEKCQWWSIATDRLSEKLNLEFKEIKYLGYLNMEQDRLSGLSPKYTIDYYTSNMSKKVLRKALTEGFPEAKNNEEFSTFNFLKNNNIIQ